MKWYNIFVFIATYSLKEWLKTLVVTLNQPQKQSLFWAWNAGIQIYLKYLLTLYRQGPCLPKMFRFGNRVPFTAAFSIYCSFFKAICSWTSLGSLQFLDCHPLPPVSPTNMNQLLLLLENCTLPKGEEEIPFCIIKCFVLMFWYNWYYALTDLFIFMSSSLKRIGSPWECNSNNFMHLAPSTNDIISCILIVLILELPRLYNM